MSIMISLHKFYERFIRLFNICRSTWINMLVFIKIKMTSTYNVSKSSLCTNLKRTWNAKAEPLGSMMSQYSGFSELLGQKHNLYNILQLSLQQNTIILCDMNFYNSKDTQNIVFQLIYKHECY